MNCRELHDAEREGEECIGGLGGNFQGEIEAI